MTSVQMMCARLGMVTGRGLAGVIRERYSRSVLWGACALLVTANTVNIGADLGGMAGVTEMVTGVKSLYWTPVYALLIASFLIWSSYYAVARIFKWLTLVLFAYVLAAFLAKPRTGCLLSAWSERACSACPVLAGSSAYAVSEAAVWRGSLADRPRLARGFYAVIAVGLLLGLGLD
jgi:Mn2+/Fe2+ NRAMP family transporter